ncbi:hypothetical protein [Paractinoplanes atraurantiacus]|uniref:VapC45 PIN like domain-containing protein n=1 Tax=Paractinoplanes atraurantiacus TaxID=1036182 RepID=A0A285JNE1_9ACTN|nr:hypothetical protein [Actinoplanes atraurantiacus]SNY61768.1 hypothetical protein SAMN05421748_12314 [Actinoplanes atraurantiacus]
MLSSESQPEFFSDRCLGRGTSRLLRQQGWIVHDITDHFENDAQDVGDPEWMEYGLSRGGSLLSQDKRIRNQVSALGLLNDHSGRIFCLSSGNLLISDRAERFQALAVGGYLSRGRVSGPA